MNDANNGQHARLFAIDNEVPAATPSSIPRAFVKKHRSKSGQFCQSVYRVIYLTLILLRLLDAPSPSREKPYVAQILKGTLP